MLTEEEYEAAKNIVVTCIHCHYYNMKSDRYVYASCCSKCKLNLLKNGLRVPETKDTKFEPSEEWHKALKSLMK